ncbi:MAG: hypothetical protein KJZ84_24915 [Bryobacteraceae bacterium]|nr:hypothetical protein [Bryobacteraceae bacterium]
MKRKKNRDRQYEPYKQIKMKLFHVPDPFGDMPREVRRKILQEAASKARATLDVVYKRLATWFENYEPQYLLSALAFYLLTTPQGVDKEAIEGKVDFAAFHLELLQAHALMRPLGGTLNLLGPQAEELLRDLRELTESLTLADVNLAVDCSDEEVHKHFVLSQMRSQTLAIRNWAYPEQALAHLQQTFAGVLEGILASAYNGVSITGVIDALKDLAKLIENRLNDHIHKVAPVFHAKDFDTACDRYGEAFPNIFLDREGMRRVFAELCGDDLEQFKALMVMHSDLRLSGIYSFSLDDAVQAYGNESGREGMRQLFQVWSHDFGDLSQRDPNHFLFANPVLHKPFIRTGEDQYFWVLCGLLSHMLPGMLEHLIPKAHRDSYVRARSKYLESQVASLFRNAFPDGRVYCGSHFRLSPEDPTVYENDILVVIDSTAIVVECKANLVDPPARRGAALRFVDTIEDLVVAASAQAHRFTAFLKANPRRHRFETTSGEVHNVDGSRLLRFIPISVTYENLGFISANLKELVVAGMIESGQPLVSSLCLTDLEVVLETLDSQAQRIHYLARRAEIERSMRYLGDELDLFAFYIETGFNVGEVEWDGTFLNIGIKSKELDPYFVARADGVSIAKPSLQLTRWWRAILARIEQRQKEFWTEIAYVFLSVAYEDQQKFEKRFKQLQGQVARGRTRHKFNWIKLVSGVHTERKYGVLGFPYRGITREQRDNLMMGMASEMARTEKVYGTVVLGLDIEGPRHYPYDVMLYLPGNAHGAPQVGTLLSGASPPTRPDFDFHLKRPRSL